ncbi:hypothetical protein [Dactylosporangium aurantiacum]|uniref:hypothetical protein n=1 Tax=Dactylosporangium aurantiacum TaxID=35754 RepID=UPI000524502B|nr:hypothetical protein [Dactylosporangium aurantiacum]MDG6100919.1 hypothetical protein [Dactylosporangium aurantiacum]
MFVYYPTGWNAGLAVIAPSLDDGGPVDGNGATLLYSGTMTDLNGNNPIAVADAYDSAGTHGAYPDLFAIVGDPVSGYTLDYYPNPGGTGMYFMANPTPLPTPIGGADWDAWRIASKLLPTGTALLLWNPSTGALFDLYAPWRRPDRIVAYVVHQPSLEGHGFATVRSADATVALCTPRDPTILAMSRTLPTKRNAIPRRYTDPLIAAWDLRRSPGGDVDAAVDRLRTRALRERLWG